MEGYSIQDTLTVVFEVSHSLFESKFDLLKLLDFFFKTNNDDSFFARIISKKMCIKIETEIMYQNTKKALWAVTFTLGAKGFDRISLLIQYFFKYLSYISKLKIKNDIYNDLQSISLFNYFFSTNNEKSPFESLETDFLDRAQIMAENILEIGFYSSLSFNKVWYDYNSGSIHELFRQLQPENAFFILNSAKFKKSDNEYESEIGRAHV